ncbi:MAG: RNA-binding S4 domain-containing protein [bacterium]
MKVRIDKWLQIVRAFKTRTQATRACELGRVKLNGVVVKPHKQPNLEDRVEIRFGDWTRILIVKGIRQKSVPKALAAKLYLDLSPPKPTLDPIDRILKGRPEQREPGSGRPTKRERRLIGKLKRR